jgi:putative FmdB family regulatory protein
MPIYEYKCINCGERFELLKSAPDGNADTNCPKCGDKDTQRILSTFATFTAYSSMAAPSDESCLPSSGG